MRGQDRADTRFVSAGNGIMARRTWVAVLTLGAVAASYLLVRSLPAFFAPAEPEGMVWIPGGNFARGSDNPAMRDARPVHAVTVSGFWMDRPAVTNEQYARFVEATGYVTAAERAPDARDFPDAPPEVLVPGSATFTPPKGAVPLDDYLG